MHSRFVILLIILSLAACTTSRQAFTPSTTPYSLTRPATLARSPGAGGTLLVRVRVSDADVRAHYVGPSTKGITISISGPTHVSKSAGLTVNARGCKSALTTVQCSLSLSGLANCPTAKPCYTGSVATYDKFNAAKDQIPRGARKLSADQHFKFSIQGGNTIVPLVLEGIPKKIAFVPASNSALTGTQQSGFVFPKCTTAAQKVDLIALDADNNYIVGIGSPALSLTSDEPQQLKIRKPNRSNPNTFALAPPSAPAYAFGNHRIHLTAKAMPGKQSGGTTASTVVNVTYSGDICGIFTEFNAPSAGAEPYGVTEGPDGNIWFAELGANKIVRMTAAGTGPTEFAVPTSAAAPTFIASGHDGNLWFTEELGSKIGRITTAGSITEFPTLTAAAFPIGITAGPDGNVWFTEQGVDKIGKVTSTGSVTEYSVPTVNSGPFMIAAGSDGNLWFTENATAANQIGRISTSGSISEFPVPTTASRPLGIAPGSDGALWFVECGASKIGRVTPSTISPTIGEFPLPATGTDPAYAVAGPDGAIWFSQYAGNSIGRLAGTGTVTEFATPTSGSQPTGITVGPDGAIWFAEFNTNKIGRLR